MILITLMAGQSFAQVDPVFSQYMQDATAFNPAYSGSLDMLSLNLQARTQWYGVAGAPLSGVFSAHAPLPGEKLGVGLRMMHEEFTVTQRLRLSPAVSYRIPLRKNLLQAGLAVNYNMLQQSYNQLLIQHTEDDMFRLASNQNYWSVGAGLYYRAQKWYAGISLPEIYTLRQTDAESGTAAARVSQGVAYGGFVYTLSPDVLIKPNVLVNWINSGAGYADLNCNVLIRQIFEVGVSGRTNGTLGTLARLQVNSRISFGYATSHNLNHNLGYVGNAHELSIQFKFITDKSAMPSPRFF